MGNVYFCLRKAYSMMKSWKESLAPLVMLMFTAALYRVMPGRIPGFAPHIAMALFGGAVLRDKRVAFALPILSLLFSDALYHVLYISGFSVIPGFYSGQLLNYLLIGSLTSIGFFIRRESPVQILAGSVAGTLIYFLLSNGWVWLVGGGWARPKTMAGLLQCYADGLPFLQTSLAGTLVFSAFLFGGLQLYGRYFSRRVTA